jgi:tetratricopeptide (TPR) repeat protein
LVEAIALTDQVLALEPDNSWAIALAGFCHAALFSNQWSDDPAASRAKAQECCARVMRVGDEDPRVTGYAVATLVSIGGDIAVASRLVDKALALTPGSSINLFWGGWTDILVGNAERGLERFQTSIRLNPRWSVRPFAVAVAGMGICLMEMRRFDEAAIVLGEAMQQLPTYPAGLAAWCASLAHAGRIDDAREAAERLRALGGTWGTLVLLQNADHRELIRSGIELAQPAPD